MIEKLIDFLKTDTTNWPRFQEMFTELNVPARTIIIPEGTIPALFFFIKTGCLRLWLNEENKDITLQFFFEGQAVSSIESLISNKISIYNIETVEPSELIAISNENFNKIQDFYPELKVKFQEILFRQFGSYASLFLSRINDSPQERYNRLVASYPGIIKRVPQYLIASYLGITPASLSKISNNQ